MCRKGNNRWFVALLSIVLMICGCSPATAQSPPVNRVVATTSEGLRFSVYLEKDRISLGEALIIRFQVVNRSQRTIFLMQKKGPRKMVDNGDVLELPFQILTSGSSYDFHYDRYKLRPGDNKSGEILIPGNLLNRRESWAIHVSFGFVTDISGLDRDVGPSDDIIAYRDLLASRIKFVRVGELVVDVD